MAAALLEYVAPGGLGSVFTESGVRPTPGTGFQNPDEYFEGAPDPAVEIVSPGDDASDLREKIKQYLDAGTAVMWIIYPRSCQIEVHTADKTIRTLGVEDTWEAPHLLPGLRLSVRAIVE